MRSIKIDIVSHDEGKVYIKHTGRVTVDDVYATGAYLFLHGAMMEDEQGAPRNITELKRMYSEMLLTIIEEISYERNKRRSKKNHG